MNTPRNRDNTLKKSKPIVLEDMPLRLVALEYNLASALCASNFSHSVVHRLLGIQRIGALDSLPIMSPHVYSPYTNILACFIDV